MGKQESKLSPEDKELAFKIETKLKAKQLSKHFIEITIYEMEKELIKRKVYAVLKDCQFNGQGMRELLSEIMEEETGS